MSIFKRFKNSPDSLPEIGSDKDKAAMADLTQAIRAELSAEAPEPQSKLQPKSASPAPSSKDADALRPEIITDEPEIEAIRQRLIAKSEDPAIDDRTAGAPKPKQPDVHIPEVCEIEVPVDLDDLLMEDIGVSEPDEETKPKISMDEFLMDEVLTTSRESRLNLSELRLDVVRITSDIDSGEALYRRAQQRIESLMGFIEQAEVAVSLIDQLEPENKLLKQTTNRLQSDYDAEHERMIRLRAEHDAQREELTQAKVEIDRLTNQLTTASQALKERNQDIENWAEDNQALKIRSERNRTDLDIQKKENSTLQTTLKELSAKVETLTADKVAIRKSYENLGLEHEDLKQAKTDLELTISELRIKHDELKTHSERMRDEFMEIQEKLMTFRASQEKVLLKRNDRIDNLETQIKHLEEKLAHREALVDNANSSVSDMRKAQTAQDIERERLERIIEKQKSQLSRAEEELLRAKQNMADMDSRYREVAEELSQAQTRRSSGSNRNPDIYPAHQTEELAGDVAEAAIDDIDDDMDAFEHLDRILDEENRRGMG